MSTDYLTVREVAEREGVLPETIRRRIRRGELPAIKPGHWRNSPFLIPYEALDRPRDPVAELARRIAHAAPALTPEQVEHLRSLLPPAEQ